MRLLADHDDLVAGIAPFAGERPRVDVRSGPAEQIAVPEQDLHRSVGEPLVPLRDPSFLPLQSGCSVALRRERGHASARERLSP